MATARQIAANRANAQRSTGPRSEAGRKASSRNARVSGVSSQGLWDAETIALIDRLEALSRVSPTGDMADAPLQACEIAQSEAWLARIRARLREVDDRIEKLITTGDFKRLVADPDGEAVPQRFGVPVAAPVAVRKTAQRLLMEPGIAVVLDPVAFLLRERALLTRYRKEAESARRHQLRGWTLERGERDDEE